MHYVLEHSQSDPPKTTMEKDSTMNKPTNLHQRLGVILGGRDQHIMSHEQFICYILMFLRSLLSLANARIFARKSSFALIKVEFGVLVFFPTF